MKETLKIIGLVLLFAGMLAYVGPRLQEYQDMEDAKQEAWRVEQLKRDYQAYLQRECGGPEATVVELANGGYRCLDKRGHKVKIIQ